MLFQKSGVAPFGLLIEPLSSNADVRDIDVNELRDLFRKEQLLVIRGFKTFVDAQDFSSYCGRFGDISVWPFGKVLELVEQNNPEDHIFDNNHVPLHWDGMYRQQIPEFQIFHCVQAPPLGSGGRTTFSNTLLALTNASEACRAQWSKVTGVYQRKMEFYDSKTISPIITTHPDRGFQILRYNEPPHQALRPLLNPPILEFEGLGAGEEEAFHASLREALYATSNFYAHEWHNGDLVIADNYTLLHGRESFETKTPRHLQRVHVLGNPPLNNPGLISSK
jgi:alpha-ketoglutarate-dependent taurine dioxygenase